MWNIGLKGALNQTRTAWREFLPVFIIVVNSFTWYGLMYAIFAEIVNGLQITAMEILVLFSTFYTGIAVSAILGSMIFMRARKSSLLMWILLGTFASTLLSAIKSSTYTVALPVSLFLGISIGMGLPSCLAYFADSTFVENRGLLGGITYGVSGLVMFLLAYILSMLSSLMAISALAMWRGLGLITLIFLVKKEENQQAQMVPSYSSILNRKTVILYLLPWIMFCLVNWTEVPLVENLFGDFYDFVVFVEFAISGIFALIGGAFADLVGRKRLTITGFILLGIEYATLSLLPEMQISWYLYVILDSVTWGMFSVVFFMVLWGDLAEGMKKEKYYVVGGLPYLLAGFLSLLIKPYVKFIPLNTAFSLASFFLFLAVIPLMYAPETLPEKKIRERELRKYIEKAKKIKEKYA